MKPLFLIYLCAIALFAQSLAFAQTAPETPPPHNSPQNLRARVQQFLDELKQNSPEEYKQLMQLKKENKEQYFRTVRSKLSDPENKNRIQIRKIEEECRALAKKYQASTDDKERELLKAQLNEKLEQSMNLVLQDTQERLQRVQGLLNHLTANRVKILNHRMNSFLQEQQTPTE